MNYTYYGDDMLIKINKPAPDLNLRLKSSDAHFLVDYLPSTLTTQAYIRFHLLSENCAFTLLKVGQLSERNPDNCLTISPKWDNNYIPLPGKYIYKFTPVLVMAKYKFEYVCLYTSGLYLLC